METSTLLQQLLGSKANAELVSTAGAGVASFGALAGGIGALLVIWATFGWLLSLIINIAIALYIQSDSRNRSIQQTAKTLVIIAWVCVGVVGLSVFNWILPIAMSIGLGGMIFIAVIGMLAGLVPIFTLIYYSTTFKRSAFSTQEWNQLGGALQGIKQSVDSMPAPMPDMAPAGRTILDEAPAGAPAWGHTVIEEPAQSSFSALRVVQGSGVGRMFDLKASGETRIGRDAALNDVIIDDAKVSGQHAKIRVESGLHTLFDLGSTNGTSVNGNKIGGPTVLHNQDKITFGTNTAVVFQIAEA